MAADAADALMVECRPFPVSNRMAARCDAGSTGDSRLAVLTYEGGAGTGDDSNAWPM